MMSSKISTKLQHLLDGEICKILISECYYTTLGDEEGELIFTGVCEGAELDTAEFGAEFRGDV